MFDGYRTGAAFFPLIGAVLQGEQDGVVYADDALSPQQFYVEHAFGFAQIFGPSVQSFESSLEQYLLIDKAFAAPKVRLYTPHLPDFLAGPERNALRSERQRFRITRHLEVPPGDGALAVTPVDARNFETVEKVFGVAGRFWRTSGDFIMKAHGVVALLDGRPAAICYAAAVADRRAEIDVLTLPNYREQGAGKFAVAQFIQRCVEHSIEPLWDCFSNNAGSVQLCLSAGFTPSGPAYPFFTINK